MSRINNEKENISKTRMNPRTRALVTLLLFFALVAFLVSRHKDEFYTGASASARSGYNFAPPKVIYTVLPENPKNKHILITGGAGFIGSQLGYFFHKQGYEVTLVDNMEYGYDDNLVVNGERFGRFVRGDVLDPALGSLMANVDTIYHFAALSALPVCQSNPEKATRVNVAGVANMLELARKHGVRRFIFASTSAVYENNKESIFTEDVTVNPYLIYSLSKYQAELLCKAMAEMYGMDVVLMRFFNVYGPHQDFRRKSPPFTSYVIRELLNKRVPVLHSDGKQKRDYVYITDLIDLAVKVMEVPGAKGHTFNVASGTSFSVNDMYDILANAIGSKIRPRYQSADKFWNSYPELFEGERPIKKEILIKEVNKFTVGSYAKAEQVLGWKPKVTMEEGLVKMVNYVRKNKLSAQTGDFGGSAWGGDGDNNAATKPAATTSDSKN